MIELLQQIQKSYFTSVRELLSNLEGSERYYGALVPYFGWGAPPADHAEHGSHIYLLTEDYRNQKAKEISAPGPLSHQTYCWAYVIDHSPTKLHNPELSRQLNEWYAHQNDNTETVGTERLLFQIGNAVSSACMNLNNLQIQHSQLTDDFVVYTDCMDQEFTSFGLKSCVSAAWLRKKYTSGMFHTWLS